MHNNGQIEESITEYKKLIQKSPRIADYHIHLANALTAKEEYEQANKEILIALSMEPKNAGYHFAKSIIDLLKQEYDQCVKSAQFAIDNGDDEIKAKALFFSGECLYGKGNIKEAVKKYETLAKKHPESNNAALAKMLVSNISKSKNSADQHRIEGVPFIKKSNLSSLSTALRMVLKYWSKKRDLSEKEINAIEFDRREPSFADAWLLLKGKKYESIITKNEIDLIKMLIDGGIPIIMRENKPLNYVVITGYDDRRKTIYYNDPKMNNRLGQAIYDGWHEDNDIFITTPVEFKNGIIKKERKTSTKMFTMLYHFTITQALSDINKEKDGVQMAEKVYQLDPEINEVKLVMAEKYYFNKDYKKAIVYYNEYLLNDNIGPLLKSSTYLAIAASYNKLGDMINAKRYLNKAKEINPESEHAYEQLLNVQ